MRDHWWTYLTRGLTFLSQYYKNNIAHSEKISTNQSLFTQPEQPGMSKATYAQLKIAYLRDTWAYLDIGYLKVLLYFHSTVAHAFSPSSINHSSLSLSSRACQKRLMLSRFLSELSKLDSFMCRLITVIWMPDDAKTLTRPKVLVKDVFKNGQNTRFWLLQVRGQNLCKIIKGHGPNNPPGQRESFPKSCNLVKWNWGKCSFHILISPCLSQ